MNLEWHTWVLVVAASLGAIWTVIQLYRHFRPKSVPNLREEQAADYSLSVTGQVFRALYPDCWLAFTDRYLSPHAGTEEFKQVVLRVLEEHSAGAFGGLANPIAGLVANQIHTFLQERLPDGFPSRWATRSIEWIMTVDVVHQGDAIVRNARFAAPDFVYAKVSRPDGSIVYLENPGQFRVDLGEMHPGDRCSIVLWLATHYYPWESDATRVLHDNGQSPAHIERQG